MFLDLNNKKNNRLLYEIIIPRPIAWIVTEDKEINIAPFSFFNAISIDPAYLSFSIGLKKNGEKKDTARNILLHKKCTICSVLPNCVDDMDLSSNTLNYNESEAKKFNIETKRLKEAYPPSIKNSPSSMFCNFIKEVDLENYFGNLFIVEVKSLFIKDEFIDKDLNINFNLLARVGKFYRELGEIIKIK